MNLSHHFAENLPSFVHPTTMERFPNLELVQFNDALGAELGITSCDLLSLLDSHPAGHAMAYSGHQFGNFVPLLGDGRALLLGELRARNGSLVDIHLKGSGRTVFSRGGDGQAPLAAMLREYVISRWLHTLGIPTTQALAVLKTGKKIARTTAEEGALLIRVAPSHIRIGTFQYAALRGQSYVQELADYSIARHYSGCNYAEFFDALVQRQAQLVAQWMRYGFVHGVLNTDNTTISGVSIDYGPCAFMEYYDPNTVFSSIDHNGRYSYGNQPGIIRWNLTRLAETLLPILPHAHLSAILDTFPTHYHRAWLSLMRGALGLEGKEHNPTVEKLIEDWQLLLNQTHLDLNAFLHLLAHTHDDIPQEELAALLPQRNNSQHHHHLNQIAQWITQWRSLDPDYAHMRTVNPAYIPRNHVVEDALKKVRYDDDLNDVKRIMTLLDTPFGEVAQDNPLAVSLSTPDSALASTFVSYCGT
ncbi:YdiU family protein [Corynebacterium sp. sy039]|uniref:protein adenylyltransferase SelO n=1 Tax=Corynebacterium sp. sy039 TaxID=2599641 RepID=UPI0011B3FDF8|nr:YdiU family protein [Corynebacterium sp. sy039]QDZ42804.1 YdiU family protein [Corynebacterium sp. sy039]